MTQTELANMALGHLGQARIADINETSVAAEHCRRMWDGVRDQLLREHHWNFATKRIALTARAEAPAFGWAKAYPLPADCLRVVSINGIPGGSKCTQWEVEGRDILTNAGTCQLVYCAVEDSVSQWDAVFCAVFSYMLAAKIAPSFRLDPGTVGQMVQLAEQTRMRAQEADAAETKPRVIRMTDCNDVLHAREQAGTTPYGAPCCPGTTGTPGGGSCTWGSITGNVEDQEDLIAYLASLPGGGTTNLGSTPSTTTVTITSSNGADATIAAASASQAGVMTAAQAAKLDGMAAGATANDTDANLKNRANHTGTQAQSTIVNLESDLAGKAALSHSHDPATTSTAGFMSAADKTKLDGLNGASYVLKAGDTSTDKQSFTTTAGAAAVRLIGANAHPSALAEGDLWFRSDIFTLFIRADGASTRVLAEQMNFGGFQIEMVTASLTTDRAQTRPDADGIFLLDSAAQSISNKVFLNGIEFTEPCTWTAGAKQTFGADSTAAGINVGSVSGDPAPLVDGDLWYNTSTGKLRARQAGTSYDVIGGGGLSGLGSVDNAIIRTDGTGGSSAQGSDLVVSDARTATQNSVGISNVHSGQSNSSIWICPLGTGAFYLGPPADGTATGGNARGASAVDLQLSRTSATQVASGANCFLMGRNSTHSGTDGATIGQANSTTGSDAFCFSRVGSVTGVQAAMLGGTNSTASGNGSLVLVGNFSQATGTYSIAMGSLAQANQAGMLARAQGGFSALGDSNLVSFHLRHKTTSATPVILALDGSSTYLSVPSGRAFAGELMVWGHKSDGSLGAFYRRHLAIKNVAGTTSWEKSPEAIGTDLTNGTAMTEIANDTNDRLDIQVTGIAAETWRWTAEFRGIQQIYGT